MGPAFESANNEMGISVEVVYKEREREKEKREREKYREKREGFRKPAYGFERGVSREKSIEGEV